jgi:hypothetical protein
MNLDLNLNLDRNLNFNLDLNLNLDPNLDTNLNLDLNVAQWLSSFEMLPHIKRTALAEQGRCVHDAPGGHCRWRPKGHAPFMESHDININILARAFSVLTTCC